MHKNLSDFVFDDVASQPHPISERIKDTIQGKDEPMEFSHPEAPPFLALWSYPVSLVIAIILSMIVFWIYALILGR